MFLYFVVTNLYASKPSKLPSATKVGKELYHLYCEGCHGYIKDKENNDDKKIDDTEEPEKKEPEKKEPEKKEVEENNKKSTVTSSLSPSQLKSSSAIEIRGLQDIPSLKDKEYSQEEWIEWVLEGKGIMPGYSEILHSTDAIKIKTYLDGL
jgi:hypothetical protein